ncbi:MAG: hypothetical protein R2856_15880 [Caldilineaceae bacterium]
MRATGGGILLDRTLRHRPALAPCRRCGRGGSQRWRIPDRWPQRVVEEEILALARMKQGVAAQIHDSWAALHQHSVLEIYGLGGTLIAYPGGVIWRNSELILVPMTKSATSPSTKTSPAPGHCHRL